MTDIKRLFDEALQDEPTPSALDMDALERVGRGKVRRRRLGMAGSGVAVVTAAALILPGALTGWGETANDHAQGQAATGGQQSQEQPEFPYPELDPDRKYLYANQDSTGTTAETEELTTAYWEYMSENVPGLTVYNINAPSNPPVNPDHYPEIKRAVSDLWLLPEDTKYPQEYHRSSDLQEKTGYERPIYWLSASDYSNDLWFSGDGDEAYSTMQISIHPKGSFETEPKSYPDGSPKKAVDPHLLTGCEDQVITPGPKTIATDYDCSTMTGPDGEDVQVVEYSVWTGADQEYLAEKTVAVAVTLDNGNAVRIEHSLMGGSLIDGEDHVHGPSPIIDMDPRFDAEQLVDLAVNLPRVVVV